MMGLVRDIKKEESFHRKNGNIRESLTLDEYKQALRNARFNLRTKKYEVKEQYELIKFYEKKVIKIKYGKCKHVFDDISTFSGERWCSKCGVKKNR